jgi:hypothetical protein
MYENWTVEGWNWIDLVAEKAIADLGILGSGHMRMALGNTRMTRNQTSISAMAFSATRSIQSNLPQSNFTHYSFISSNTIHTLFDFTKSNIITSNSYEFPSFIIQFFVHPIFHKFHHTSFQSEVNQWFITTQYILSHNTH